MAWGRVALLLAAGESTILYLDAVADIVAYTTIPEPTEKSKAELPYTGANKAEENTTESSVQENVPQMIFWQITKIIKRNLPDNEPSAFLLDQNKAAQFNRNKEGSYVFAAAKPLVTLTQLAPLLINSLGRKVSGQQLDFSKILRSISQGKPIKKLAYHQASRWPLQLTILVDKHFELYTYWSDFDHIVHQLQTQLGKTNVQVITLHERNLFEFVAKKYSILPSLLILVTCWTMVIAIDTGHGKTYSQIYKHKRLIFLL